MTCMKPFDIYVLVRSHATCCRLAVWQLRKKNENKSRDTRRLDE